MHAFPLYVLVCCVGFKKCLKTAHAAVAPVCCCETTLRCRVRRVFYILLLLKKCGPSGRRRRSVLMRG